MTAQEFARLCERYRPVIYKMAHALWASPVDAEEAVARVRGKLLTGGVEVRRDGFVSLWRVALQNDAISYVQKRKREVAFAEAKCTEVDAAAMVDAGFSPYVLFALATLTELERYVMLSHVIGGLSLARIGQALQVSRQTAGEVFRRARAKLILELKDYALNYRIIHPRDVTAAVEWALRTLQKT